MSCACIEHLDFSHNLDLAELDIQPFKQIQHTFIGYTSLTEGPKLVAKQEVKRDFVVSPCADLIEIVNCLSLVFFFRYSGTLSTLIGLAVPPFQASIHCPEKDLLPILYLCLFPPRLHI